MFLGYSSRRGYTLLDRRLYVPREWLTAAAYAQRRRQCRLPREVTFQTKAQLGQAMLGAVVEAGTLRARWVTADAAFGTDTALLDAIEALGLWYFVEVPLDTRVWVQRPATYCPVHRRRRTQTRLAPGEPAAVCVSTVAATLAPAQWTRHRIKEGSQGPLLADLAWQRVMARRHSLPGPEVWVVFRRPPLSGELKAYLSNAPASVRASELIRLSGMRWPIEMCFEDSKQTLGLGDYETRPWIGWHHHMTLCILAHHFVVKLQQRLKKNSSTDPASGGQTAGRAAAQAPAHPADRLGPARVLAASQPGRLPLTPWPPSGAGGAQR